MTPEDRQNGAPNSGAGRVGPSIGRPHGVPHARPPGVEADTGQGPAETGGPPDQPQPRFEITGVRAVKHAAAPTLSFTMEVEDSSGREIFMAGLSVQIQIEPSKRRYEEQDKARLAELFGDPHRWSTTAQRMLWTIESVLLPAFKGSTTIEIPVLCNYDLELAAAKYFYSVSEGEIPLAFHFNGSVYYGGDDGKLQVVQVSWDTVAAFKMPISVWREMIDSYYPYRGWIPVHRDTLDQLQRLRVRRGSPTFDAVIVELLAAERATDPNAGPAPEPAMRPLAENPPEKA